MAEQWMSIVEYARTFKVSDMTVRRRIKTGRLHAVLQEGKYFIPVPVDARGMPMPIPDLDAPMSVPVPVPARAPVMKSHPAAHKTYQPPAPVAAPQHQHQPQHQHHQPQHQPRPVVHHKPALAYTPEPDFDDSGDPSQIPGTLRRSLASQETSLVDTRALLAFCEASLRKLGEMERRQAEKFKSKLETLESMLAGKDLELKQLRQQVEDLQLLVKFLDVKKKPA